MVLLLVRFRLLLLGGLLLSSLVARAQTDSLMTSPALPPRVVAPPGVAQKDIGDMIEQFFPRLHSGRRDTVTLEDGHKFVSIIPVIGYTLQTHLLFQVAGNVAFQQADANMSTLVSAVAVTMNKQVILTATSSVWTPGNKINWIGDWRLMHYPQRTYGLGMHTTTQQSTSMDFEYLRVYQTMLRRLLPNIYGGLGYHLDYHWNIESTRADQEVHYISRYRRGVTGSSISSGVAVNLLYDSRGNAINPQGGAYVNVLYRPNLTLLGSDTNYQMLLLEFRKYLHLRPQSNNILALWSYNAITVHGTPPYLDLPSTGWDTYSNLGRGFIQGRFRGKNLLYTEAEYRFGITRNRLLGGVVFTNAQTVAEPVTNRFDRIVPAAGLGLRLTMNKLSRTNLAIDYGFGGDGSKALTFNVGEVF